MKTPANLTKRAISSAILIAGLLGILIGDEYNKHGFFLYICIMILSSAAVYELCSINSIIRPRIIIILAGVLLLITGEWMGYGDWKPTAEAFGYPAYFSRHLLPVLCLVLISSFVVEVLVFDASGKGLQRIALTLLAVIYLGVLPLFLIKLRGLKGISGLEAFAATIFVPKIGDVGAYLIGSLIGKHKMTPMLSPKKTWEGFFGGLIVSILTAIVINQIGPEPLFKRGIIEAAAFGLVVGLAGVFGDLFASMIKRDAQVKDASQTIPGFGGVLDVVDSVLFAAPVAYLFFVL